MITPLRVLFLACSVALFSAGSVSSHAQVPTYVVDSNYADANYLPAYSASAKTSQAYANKLEAAATLLLRSRDVELRVAANDTLRAGLNRALAKPFGDSVLTALTQVSVLGDADQNWQVITWQLFVNDSTYTAAGIFHSQATGAVQLLDSAQQLGYEGEYELRPEQWYGAVYYAIRPFTTANGADAWVLFGYDADGFAHRRKVADVLTFDPSGAPLFGAEVFRGAEGRPNVTFSRLLLEYRADARVGLNYDEALKGIAFDRLVSGPPVRRGGPPSYVPDGSYDGYVLNRKQGVWEYRPEWFDRVISEEPPSDGASSSTAREKRDLFGRTRRAQAAQPD